MTKKKKLVVIDGQILQTGAWHRGMGKYTLQILKEMSDYAANQTETVFYLLLNTNLENHKERVEALTQLCPNVQLIKIPLPLPSETLGSADIYKKSLTEQLKMKLNGQPFDFLLTALFLFDFYAEYPEGAHRSLLFYDLTPLLFWRDLGGYFPPELYMPRFKQILEADTVYAISQTTKNDLIAIFGIDEEKIFNINGGFSKLSERVVKPTTFSVPKEYALFPTGDLPHKNNSVAVRGFERFISSTNSSMKLLITSHFSEESRLHLLTLSSNIIFTENVTDAELEWLYEHAKLVLFASKYEGLGIPMLDAVANDKPVVTSRISVFREMSTDGFYFFDPNNELELCEQLVKAVKDKDFAGRKAQYRTILDRYSWGETFRALWARMITTSPSGKGSKKETGQRRPKLAIACLHPGIGAQIGRRAERYHATLSEYFDIDYFFDPNGYYYREMERPTFLDFVAQKTYDIAQLNLKKYGQYDHVLFFIDEQALPSRLMQRAIVLPGSVLISTAMSEVQLYDEQKQAYELLSNSRYALHIDGDSADVTEKIRFAVEEVIKKESSGDIKKKIGGFKSKRTIMNAMLEEYRDR